MNENPPISEIRTARATMANVTANNVSREYPAKSRTLMNVLSAFDVVDVSMSCFFYLVCVIVIILFVSAISFALRASMSFIW